MKKILGIFFLFVAICAVAGIANPDFFGEQNIQNIIRWSSLFAIISVGVAFVIITGGIDLSIGSVIALTGVILALSLQTSYHPVDQFDLLEVDREANRLTVAGDGRALSPGDRIAYGDSAVLTVASVSYQPDAAPEDAGPAGATTITVEQTPPDNQPDAITRAAAIAEIEIDGDAGRITLDGEHPQLAAGDRLMVLRETFLPRRYRVASVDVADGRTAVTIRGSRSASGAIGATFQQRRQPMSIPAALALTLAVSAAIGLAHGLLITKLGLQPFVVTLCGLLLYRGVARWIADDQVVGFGSEYESLKFLASGETFSMGGLFIAIGATLLLLAGARLLARLRRGSEEGRGWDLLGLVAGAALIINFALPAGYQPWITLALLIAAVGAFLLRGLASAPRLTFLFAALFLFSPLIGYGAFASLDAAVAAGSSLTTAGITALGLLLTVAAAYPFIRDALRRLGARAQLLLVALAVALGLFLVSRIALGQFPVPIPFLILIGLGILAATLLNRTIYGRYLLALGRNEEAARYSGIHTDRMTILAYVICSLLAGVAGILFALDLNSVSPASHGAFYELYAIAAAVLGGCSLRGGEGSILGVIIGAAVTRVLYNAINLLGIATQLEPVMVGAVILLGVTADELVKRFAAARPATPPDESPALDATTSPTPESAT